MQIFSNSMEVLDKFRQPTGSPNPGPQLTRTRQIRDLLTTGRAFCPGPCSVANPSRSLLRAANPSSRFCRPTTGTYPAVHCPSHRISYGPSPLVYYYQDYFFFFVSSFEFPSFTLFSNQQQPHLSLRVPSPSELLRRSSGKQQVSIVSLLFRLKCIK